MLHAGCWSVCNCSILRRLKAIYIIAKESIHTAQTCVVVIKRNWLIPCVETIIGYCDKHRNTKINCVRKYNLVVSRDVAHICQTMWHTHSKRCGTYMSKIVAHMPKDVAHTCQKAWPTHAKECGTHLPKGVAHTHVKNVAHTCQRMRHTHAEGCGTQMPKDVTQNAKDVAHNTKYVAHKCRRMWHTMPRMWHTYVLERCTISLRCIDEAG
jgi:hypothetical protein